uniref:1-acyl-sn-glycerol-3-phosphate acyltransferase n=2 Tax=Grammatophora oceanica TaxID=210454 RepID=A0A7S1XZP6_9STRA|mmetsp:Transcript_12286/g.18030  ORF Transcript_12286/g.18030 Transcript_12286/m.18030 type:complete len:365 (+) Transcript_12286:97-1191(+)
MMKGIFLCVLVSWIATVGHGWTTPRPGVARLSHHRSGGPRRRESLVTLRSASAAAAPGDVPLAAAETVEVASSSSSSDETTTPPKLSKKERLRAQARKEGGPLIVPTPGGFLNPYGAFYLATSVFLGLFWFAGLVGCQFLYLISGNRIDKLRRLPITLSQIWGETLMFLTRAHPRMEGKEKLLEFYKQNRAAMFVSNHNSWHDIPIVGHTIGWRNYKIVAKKELGKVPILGKAIKIGGHIMVDRTNRRSQFRTLKAGIDFLKRNVMLCTFPEGTRSKSGRLGNFKNGAFKMAHKVGAPVIPMSIVGAAKCMPYYWVMPFRAPWNVCKVIVHDPIESKDITEAELATKVRDAIISGLPDEQKPLK